MAGLRFIQSTALVVVAVSAFGCQLPNVQPFAEATAELRSAVVDNGAATVQAVKTASLTYAPPGAAGDADAGDELAGLWQDRVRAMDVMVVHADSLANIVAASEDAGATATALGESIAELADLVPVGGTAVSEGVNLGTLLLRVSIQVKAAHDVGEAVEKAHPALAEVGRILILDLEDLGRLHLNASLTLEERLEDEYGARNYYRGQLLGKRDDLREQLTDTFNDANADQVAKIEDLIAKANVEYNEYRERRAALLSRRAAAAAAIEQSKQGVRAWVRAHGDLRLAIEQNRQPNVRLLLTTVQEIREAVDRLRDN